MATAWGLLCAALSSSAQVNVTTYHNNNQRDGLNASETLLTPANVRQDSFGKLFSHGVDGDVYAQPLYVSGLDIPGKGTLNVVFVATEHNSVYAFNADSDSGVDGGLLWHASLGVPADVPTPDFGNRYGGFDEIHPEVGITGTPVIDLLTGTLYVDAFTHEGSSYHHWLHALNITNGQDRAFSPVEVSASVPGNGVGGSDGRVIFEAKQQLQRAALTLAGGVLYVCYAGYADTNPYHGWVIGFAPGNLQQLSNHIFNTSPNSSYADYGEFAGEGGIWMAGGGLSADDSGNLYLAIGNGSFNAVNNSGGTEYSDTFVRLSTDNGLSVADYFAPYNQEFLATNDLDLGSGGLVLFSDPSGPNPHLLAGGGKEGRLYLLNRDQFTAGDNHYNVGGSSDAIVQSFSLDTGVFGTPAFFDGRLYFASVREPIEEFVLANGQFQIPAASASARSFPYPGATPSVSANGTSDGIVWALVRESPAVLVAYEAANLGNEIYASDQAPNGRDALTDGVKFAVPTVANGKVYVGSHDALTVFGLLNGGGNPGTIEFDSTNYSVSSDADTAVIPIVRTGGSSGSVAVTAATTSGGTAVAGVDYQNVSNTLMWADGDTAARNLYVPILTNSPSATNRTVRLMLSGVSGGAQLGPNSTAELTILPDVYAAWKSEYFGTNANDSTVAGDSADPDGDGFVNLVEYALASDPIAAGQNPVQAEIVSNQFRLEFSRNTSATNLTITVQTTDSLDSGWSDLKQWTANGGWVDVATSGTSVSESAPSGSPPDERVEVTLNTPVDSAPAVRFFRIEISR